MSTAYDEIIDKYRGVVPLEFVRNLIKHESGFNPNSDMGLKSQRETGVYLPGAAKGLMQVVGIVLQDFNQRYLTNYTPLDLFDPEVNIKLGTDTLNRIFTSYARNHPFTLAPNWNDQRWLELFIFGWNAGYSEAGGVGRVVRALEQAGIPKEKITVDNVSAMAEKVGASKHLSNPDKVRWSKAVAQSFYAEAAQAKKMGQKSEQ